MKDFNDCLQTLCRSLIKYGETQMRQLAESNSMKLQSMQHLVYVRERQMDYYKNKCSQFVTDIDKMINAKMTEKGSNMIYELDNSAKELRMMKDNIFLMEKMMREEIHKDYSEQLIFKDNQIKKLRESFKSYKNELNEDIKADIDREQSEIEPMRK